LTVYTYVEKKSFEFTNILTLKWFSVQPFFNNYIWFVCQTIQVVNSEGADISFQVDSTCNLLDTPSMTSCFQLHFIVELGPLEIKKYTIINLPTDISTK